MNPLHPEQIEVSTAEVYTCPMHSQVRQTNPGSCPLCGMGLEPESASAAETGPNPELVDFTCRFPAAHAFNENSVTNAPIQIHVFQSRPPSKRRA
jgi:hypothetical protein